MELSEEAALVLRWMSTGSTLHWLTGLKLQIGPLLIEKETKDELENQRLICQQTAYHITPAGREALREDEAD